MARTKLSVLQQPDHELFYQTLVDLNVPLTQDLNALRRYLPSILNKFAEEYINELEAANEGTARSTSTSTSSTSSSRQPTPILSTSTSTFTSQEKGKGREISRPDAIPLASTSTSSYPSSSSSRQVQIQPLLQAPVGPSNGILAQALQAQAAEAQLRAQEQLKVEEHAQFIRDKWYFEQGIQIARNEVEARRVKEIEVLKEKARKEQELRDRGSLKVILQPRKILVPQPPPPLVTIPVRSVMVSIGVQTDKAPLTIEVESETESLEPQSSPEIPLVNSNTSKVSSPTDNAPLSPPEQRQSSNSRSPSPSNLVSTSLALSLPLLVQAILEPSVPLELTTNNLIFHTQSQSSSAVASTPSRLTSIASSIKSHITIDSDLTTLSEVIKRFQPILPTPPLVVVVDSSVISDLSDIIDSDDDEVEVVEEEETEAEEERGNSEIKSKKDYNEVAQKFKFDKKGKRLFDFWIEVEVPRKRIRID